MEIVLIADGKLSETSLMRRLPLFFLSRLVDMSNVSKRAVGDARLIVLDLDGATPDGLVKLKVAAAHFSDLPIICLVSRASRREVVQAGSLGRVEMFDRADDFDGLVRLIRSHLQPFLKLEFAESVSQDAQFAVSDSSRVMDELFLTAVTQGTMPMRLLTQAARSIGDVVRANSLSDWLTAVRGHHSLTYRHSLDVAGLAAAFAQKLEWSDADQDMVTAGGLMHDIGKVRIPIYILDKSGALTGDEKLLIQKHPGFGRDILKSRLDVPRELKKMAVQHHEFLDGSGYPDGLKADRIDPMVRLMTICDIFAALTEARSYKDSLSPRAAFAGLVSLGDKLDRKLLRKFKSVVLDAELGDVNRQEITPDMVDALAVRG